MFDYWWFWNFRNMTLMNRFGIWHSLLRNLKRSIFILSFNRTPRVFIAYISSRWQRVLVYASLIFLLVRKSIYFKANRTILQILEKILCYIWNSMMESIFKNWILMFPRYDFSLIRLVIQVKTVLNIYISAKIRGKSYSSCNYNSKI